ncbi:MAG: site-specific DNA-methyltransferase [Verrucomicrobiota bacterium]
MAIAKQTKRVKRKTPNKKAHKDRAVYSLPQKKKGKLGFQSANGEHSNGKNGSLHEDAIPYRTQFTSVLDIAPPPTLEIEPRDADEILPREISEALAHIEKLNLEAEIRWADKLCVDNSLTRALVSFQANKGRAVYRWFKYKEAFSAGLIEHLLSKYRITKGILLDPFAGSGTAMFAAGGLGMKSEGIELLPIGRTLIATKQLIDLDLTDADIKRLAFWRDERPWRKSKTIKPINELRITRGAYPAETLDSMGKFLAASEQEGERVQAVLLFALLCILENISYTRKDGQYLRWDYRSGRRQGKKIFNKGEILAFDKAITDKLHQMVDDLRSGELPEDLFAKVRSKAEVKLHGGSCLDILPQLKAKFYDSLITSPPYCNRYDYTRTYALELALLGVSEDGLVKLRQEMLSCTVENRAKDLLALNPKWKAAVAAADNQPLLQSILAYLDSQKELDLLNNDGIPRMVRGYFYEMACVIFESARVLKSGAPLIMVNDNVRYAGASISVDIILSEIAEQLGFAVEQILVLPNGKGNSSQQMGAHGRDALRKCVYLWRKN